jgi:hypothetical protein
MKTFVYFLLMIYLKGELDNKDKLGTIKIGLSFPKSIPM